MVTTTSIYNFAAGPAVLPLPVLEEAQRDLVALPGVGMSVMEISHRSKVFDEIIQGAEADFRALAGVPDGYHVLFLQGGAYLAEIPALDQGHAFEAFLAAYQHAQQHARRGARRDLVTAGLDLARLAREAKPAIQQHRMHIGANGGHGFGHALGGGAGLDLQVQHLAARLRLQGQGFVQPPADGTKHHQTGEKRQHEQTHQETTHNPVTFRKTMGL